MVQPGTPTRHFKAAFVAGVPFLWRLWWTEPPPADMTKITIHHQRSTIDVCLNRATRCFFWTKPYIVHAFSQKMEMPLRSSVHLGCLVLTEFLQGLITMEPWRLPNSIPFISSGGAKSSKDHGDIIRFTITSQWMNSSHQPSHLSSFTIKHQQNINHDRASSKTRCSDESRVCSNMINQPTNQTNQPTNQPTNQLINQPTNHQNEPMHQPTSWSTSSSAPGHAEHLLGPGLPGWILSHGQPRSAPSSNCFETQWWWNQGC